MRHYVYEVAVCLTAILVIATIALASTLLFSDVTLPKVVTAMLSGVFASATGAVAICTYQTPYELEQARARRAYERLKKSGPPPVPNHHQ